MFSPHHEDIRNIWRELMASLTHPRNAIYDTSARAGKVAPVLHSEIHLKKYIGMAVQLHTLLTSTGTGNFILKGRDFNRHCIR
jgi:hypothetical protein